MVVPGRGNPHADGLIIGEAPGAEEEKQGRPFVGRSGQLLSECLAEAGLDEEQDVWITNVIKRRPPGNATPVNREVRAARDDLIEELARVDPTHVLGLGNVPLLAMTDQEGGITDVRGNWRDVYWITPDAHEISCQFMGTYHPSYVLRNGGRDSLAGQTFQGDITRFAAAIRGSNVPTTQREEVSVGNGFFDEYKEVGGNFVKAEEKQVLIDNGIPFQIVDVVEDNENKFGPRFIANVLLPDPETGTDETRSIGFPKSGVESRDRMLRQMMEYLQRDDAQPVMVKLEKVGRSIIIRNAAPAAE